MILIGLIAGVWCGAGMLLWRHLERKEAWQRQLKRYTLLPLGRHQEVKPPRWQRWQWYQNAQTFLSPKKLQ